MFLNGWFVPVHVIFATLPSVLLKIPTGFSHLSSSEKKRYRESYISDTLDMDLDPSDKNSRGSGSSGGSRRDNRLSRQSTGSHGSSHTSGIEADSRHRVSVEMSVDEPFSIDRVHRKEKSCSSTISYGSSGIDSGSKGRAEDDSQDDGKGFGDADQLLNLLFSIPAGKQGVRECEAAWSRSVMLTLLLLLSSS